MTKKPIILASIVAALMLALLPLTGSLQYSAVETASAQAEGEVIAEGFNGPQGVLIDPDGNVWVIDSGLGGDQELDAVNPETGEVTKASFGDTARVVKIGSDGSQEVVAMLPSFVVGQEAVGGARLALLDGSLYATVGQWTDMTGPEPAPLVATIVKIEDGTVTEAAPVWRTEKRMNPDGAQIDSHPYGLAAGPEGKLWMADAGGNTVLRIDPATKAIETIAAIKPLPGVFPNPFRNGELLTDAVPTGVAFDADGNAYVSILSGAPFVPGTAKVLKVGWAGSVADYATNLTMLTDLRTGPDGELYAVQFGLFTDQGPTPNSGAIIRVKEGEVSEVVADGLSFPTSIDFDADGNAYVTINGVGAPGSGAVVKYAALTSAPGMAAAAQAEATATAEPEAEPTATAQPEEEPTATAEPEAEPTATAEPEPEATATAEPEAEPTATAEPEPEATATAEPEAEPTATSEPEPEATATAEPEAEAAMAEAPAVMASDQESTGDKVTVDSVTAAEAGWMVIHADADGKPGPVIGKAAVPAGTTDNVVVFLDEAISGEAKLWAMLHLDAGTVGTYEFPGPDGPVKVGDAIVMAPFTATAPEAEAAAMPTATAQPELEATTTPEPEAEAAATGTPEPEAEAEVTGTPQPEEEATGTPQPEEEAPMAGEKGAEMAPEQMPATGISFKGPNTFFAVALVLAGLIGGAYVTRRRK